MKLLARILNARNRETCEKVLRVNSGESLEWREVRSLFSELGQIAWQANGDCKVTCRGHVLILLPAPTKDVTKMDERMELRCFLEKVERSISDLAEIGASGQARPVAVRSSALVSPWRGDQSPPATTTHGALVSSATVRQPLLRAAAGMST